MPVTARLGTAARRPPTLTGLLRGRAGPCRTWAEPASEPRPGSLICFLTAAATARLGQTSGTAAGALPHWPNLKCSHQALTRSYWLGLFLQPSHCLFFLIILLIVRISYYYLLPGVFLHAHTNSLSATRVSRVKFLAASLVHWQSCSYHCPWLALSLDTHLFTHASYRFTYPSIQLSI